MVELIEKLLYAHGISGRESNIRDVILEEIKPYADEITIDALGNVIAHKNGKGKKIMFCAHMDEVGFFVTCITEKGLLRTSSIGNVNLLSASFSKVVSSNGTIGILIPDANDKIPQGNECYINIGAKNKRDAEEKVKVGDFFVCEPNMIKLSDNVYAGRPFDNRAGCVAIIEAMKQIKDNENDIYFVFTTQNEVGKRGAKTASYSVCADVGIAVDTVSNGCNIGSGAGICVKDDRIISSPEIVEIMRNVSEKEKIKTQNVVSTVAETDVNAIQSSPFGILSGAILIPCENLHTSYEIINTEDVENTVKLIVAVAKGI